MEAERLIEEVEARPGLYDKTLPEYVNKRKKDSLWMDVTRTLVEDWDDMSVVEKNVQCKDVQLKWKHIRDNFRRELLAQKKGHQGGKKKRKYKYFDQMLFLIPYVSDANPSTNNNASESIDLDLKEENQTLVEVEIDSPNAEIDSPPSMNRPPPRNTYTRNKYTQNSFTQNIKNSRRRKKKITVEEEILKVLKSKDNLDTDEDRTFCLSLVSSMKKMSDATKLNAKIDILKIIRQYSVPRIDISPTQTIRDPLIHEEELTGDHT